jgi:hypothetical protein
MVLSIMACAFIAFCATAAVLFLPFNPLTYHSLSVPSEICPGENVTTTVDYELDEGEFSSIRAMDVQTSWVAEDVPELEHGTERIVTELTITQDQLSPGRNTHGGRAIRPAPETPGVWWLELNIVVRGTPWIQEVKVVSDNTITVLSEDDPQCEDET